LQTTRAVEQDGVITEVELTQQKVTISYEGANTNFGRGPKAGIHIQVPLPEGIDYTDTDAVIEAVGGATQVWGNFAKAYVAGLIQAPYKIVDGEVVVEFPEVEEKPKASRGGSTTTRRPSGGGGQTARRSQGGGDGDIAAKVARAWEDISNNPNGWFDNRAQKAEQGGNGPDFKGKRDNGEFAGFGVWLDGKHTPEWVAGQYGEVF